MLLFRQGLLFLLHRTQLYLWLVYALKNAGKLTQSAKRPPQALMALLDF